MRISTALLRKFQSSTYHRYASGWNLLSALYLLRLFAKGISEAARMPLVLRSNKFALQTCSSRMCKDVHFKTAKDGSGSTQKRVRLRTRSPKMNKDVHFWARVFCKHDNLIVNEIRYIVSETHIEHLFKPYVL